MAAPISRTDSTLVIGLGRFGSAVAATLDRLGREVLAVESDPIIVRQWAGRIPLVEADATDMEALEQLGELAYDELDHFDYEAYKANGFELKEKGFVPLKLEIKPE